VSHSARLAEGTADLAAQVGGGTVMVVAKAAEAVSGT